MKLPQNRLSRIWPSPRHLHSLASPPRILPVGLILPLEFPTEFLDLSRVEPSIDACLAHFEALKLEWTERRGSRAGLACATSLVSAILAKGENWVLLIAESGCLGRHQHRPGALYGEVTITLAGELADQTDDGREVILKDGEVIFHAPDTVHKPFISTFWAGLVHQPCGATSCCEAGLSHVSSN